ncbi:MAG: hypothetical protein QOH25_2281 [Acidobacteriota bacterium]|jgi:hypothetical protein|nr:hypothetical protein [Acidobacteriota bacterium]
MASEKSLLRALDLLTVAPHTEIQALTLGGSDHARSIKRIVGSKNVVAVGISEKESKGKMTGYLALTFYVEKKVPLSQLRANDVIPPALPESVGGPHAISTDVKAIGLIHPEINVTRNPVQPGNSIGHVNVTAGTLGAFVEKDKQLLILSNSHVLANCGKGKVGDVILYPGKHDGGKKPKDSVAKLVDFVEFQVGGDFVNKVDCALAEPLERRMADIKKGIKGLGLPKGIIKPKRGMKITKVGRTTGKTTGRVLDINFRTTINYPGVGFVGFIDQVLCTRYTDGGDSGSLVIDKESGKAVGLHFSGSAPAGESRGSSIFNPIHDVLEALGVKLVTK